MSGQGSTKIERLDRACGGKSTVLGSLGRRKVKWTAIYDWLGAAGVSRRLGARLGEGDRAVGAAGPADTSMQRARSFLQCGRRQSGDSEQGSVKGTGRLVRLARPFLPCSEQDQSSSAARRQSGDSEQVSVKGTGRSARRARPFLPCSEQVQSSSAARRQSGDSEQGSVKGTGRSVRLARPVLPCSEQDHPSRAVGVSPATRSRAQ